MVTAGIFPFKENSHGRAGNRTRDLMISSQRLWPLDHETGLYYINVIKCQDLHIFELVFTPLAANIERITVKKCQIAVGEVLVLWSTKALLKAGRFRSFSFCAPFQSTPLLHLKVKVKWSRYRPGVAQRVGRFIDLLFHDRGTRRGWVFSSTLRPHFTLGKEPVPILQEAGWAPGPVWTGGKSFPTGIRSWTSSP